MKIAMTWLISMLSVASCQDKAIESPALPAKTLNNVAYGSDPKQKMDVYLPAGRSTAETRVVILIHGGGWNQGDKADFTPFLDSLKKRLPGYAVFNLNYRLNAGATNRFPSQEEDIRAAIEYIYSKSSEYMISSDYALVGASAGAHLALLHAYKYETPVKIKAVIDFFGPAELTDLYNNPINPLVPVLLQSVTGGTPSSHATIYQQSSPQGFVTPQSPPTLVLHGGLDGLVPVSQSQNLRNALQAAGVPCEYVFYPNENHGWTGPSLTDSFDRVTAFLNLHMN
jgi:acetyl esterase/lipase